MKPDDLVAILGAVGILLTAFGAYRRTHVETDRMETQAETEAEQAKAKLDEERYNLAVAALTSARETIEILKKRVADGETERLQLDQKLSDCESQLYQKTRPRPKRSAE